MSNIVYCKDLYCHLANTPLYVTIVFTFIACSCKNKYILLRSFSSDFLPRVTTNIGACLSLFSVSLNVRSVENITQFRRHLKTYMFIALFIHQNSLSNWCIIVLKTKILLIDSKIDKHFLFTSELVFQGF